MLTNREYSRFFDKAFCINLDSRPDRWEECKLEFEKIGLEHYVERVPAFQMSPGIAGCSKSHHECVRLAKLRNYKRVLILEDDVTFIGPQLYDLLCKAHDQLEHAGLSYHMLYFSANLRGDQNHLIDSNLAKIVSAKAAHAYILDNSTYDFILDAYSDINWSLDWNWTHTNPNRMNMDVWYKNIQAYGHTYGVYPSLAEQRHSYSDLINEECYYNLSAVYNKILENA